MQNEYAPLRVLVIGHAMLIGYRQSKSKIQFKQCTQCEQYPSFMPLNLYWFGVFVFSPDDIRMFNVHIPSEKVFHTYLENILTKFAVDLVYCYYILIRN